MAKFMLTFGTNFSHLENQTGFNDCKTFTTQTFTTPDVHHPQCKIRRLPPQTFTTPNVKSDVHHPRHSPPPTFTTWQFRGRQLSDLTVFSWRILQFVKHHWNINDFGVYLTVVRADSCPDCIPFPLPCARRAHRNPPSDMYSPNVGN